MLPEWGQISLASTVTERWLPKGSSAVRLFILVGGCCDVLRTKRHYMG